MYLIEELGHHKQLTDKEKLKPLLQEVQGKRVTTQVISGKCSAESRPINTTDVPNKELVVCYLILIYLETERVIQG